MWGVPRGKEGESHGNKFPPIVVRTKITMDVNGWLIRRDKVLWRTHECHTLDSGDVQVGNRCLATSLSPCIRRTINRKPHPRSEPTVWLFPNWNSSICFVLTSRFERWTLMANCVSLYGAKRCIKKKKTLASLSSEDKLDFNEEWKWLRGVSGSTSVAAQ